MDSGTIKVFISSTFRDLDEERNYLVRKVFPEINAILDDIQVNEVDLRWGITDEQGKKHVVDLCLKYLYESRPFFVGIIGDRYGSIISPDNIELSSLVENVYPQIRDDINNGLSVTEIEILNGTLRAPEDNRPYAIFFVKHTEKPGSDENEESFRKLQNLKQRILNQNIYPVYEYKKLNDLDKVKDFILKKLENPHKKEKTKQYNNNLAAINKCVKRLNAYRSFIPDDFTVLDQLIPFIERAKPIAVLEGLEGSGKSTMVAQLGQNYKGCNRLFIHLYGNVVDFPATNSMFFDYFLRAAKQVLQRQYEINSSQKGIKGWVTRAFKKVDLDDVSELVWLIGRCKWCIVLDDIEALRLSTISPMLYIIPAIVNGLAIIEKRYNVKIDYRILVVQTPSSPYNLNKGDFEKYVMPMGKSINVKKYVDDYLSSYCKNLDSEQLQSLYRSPIGKHPRSLYLACEYLRKWCTREQIPQFIKKISAYNRTADVYLLFINQLQSMIDGVSLRKLVGLISLFPYGLNKASLEKLSGMSTLDFYTAWSCLSKMAVEEPTGAIHWANLSIASFINDIFNVHDEAFRTSLASECSLFISQRIKLLFTPEKLFESININPYLYLNYFVTSFPEPLRSEYYEKIYPMRIKLLTSSVAFSDDIYQMSLLAFLKDKGCFHIDYIKEYVYPQGLRSFILNGLERERWRTTRAKGESALDFAKAYTAKFISNEGEKIAYWRAPTQWEVLCYLESLIISRDWKQLEIELINPEIINYVWQTSVYLDCWILAIKEGGISIIQPSMRDNDKMLYVSCALRNVEAIKYYSENKK